MNRKELLEKLNRAIENLYVAAECSDKDIAVFLHQSINSNADEQALSKIIKDVEKFSKKWMKH